MLSIAEAAAETGLTAHTLRYYERDGLIEVRRSRSGHRRYSEDDVEWIRMIARLRATGMPIREIRRYAELVRTGSATESARVELLHSHRDVVRRHLAEMTSHLEAIEAKIAYVEGAVSSCQATCGVSASSRADSADVG